MSICETADEEKKVKGSGNIETQTVDVSNFDQITLEISGDVYVEHGPTESVTVETDDNILPLLETKVRGKELVLTTKPNQGIDPSRKIVYRITAKDLRGISIRGSGNFNVSPLQSDSMDLSLDGSGNIEIDDLATGKLSLDRKARCHNNRVLGQRIRRYQSGGPGSQPKNFLQWLRKLPGRGS